MLVLITTALLSLCLTPAFAGYANFNTVLLGERAAGMGGAFTALVGDASAGSFYNPASLARMDGSTLSAAVSAYNKYDTSFDEKEKLSNAALRINRGSIVPVPTSSGSVYAFGNFALALSIIVPDFDTYNGQISNDGTDISILNFRDESLWIGGSFSANISNDEALGFTMYYTSRTFLRSAISQSVNGGITTILNEEKSFATNSMVYILGYYKKFGKYFSMGLSHRPPSIPVSGEGAYFRTSVDTGGGATNVNNDKVKTITHIPAKTVLGFAYEEKQNYTLALDIQFYDSESYTDMNFSPAAEQIDHKAIWNVNLGGEYYIKPWLGWRWGLFTNHSSHPAVTANPTRRQPDNIDMWGWSTNFAVYTNESSSITLGGYYTGGKGHSAQYVGQSLKKIPKTFQTFALLVGTSFLF